MKIEDIEKYLKVGCKVQLDTRDFPIEITHFDEEYVWNRENGHAVRHNWRSIKDIISWPIPSGFEQKHEGHWIKLVDEKRSSIIVGLLPYVGKWFQMKAPFVHERPSITVTDEKGNIVFDSNVSFCHIGDYRPIPPKSEALPEDQYYEIKLSDVKVGDQVMSLDCWCTVTERDGDTFKLSGRTSRYKALCNDLKARRKITPISDEEFNSLKPGDRLKLATAEYIDSKCNNGYYQGVLHGSNRVCRTLKEHYGNDSAKVKCLLTEGRITIENGYVIHRDFVVGVIKMQEKKPYPLVECKDLSILHCEVGDFIKLNSQHPSWIKVIDPPRRLVKFSGGGESQVYSDYIKYRIQNFFSFPSGWFYRVHGVWYQYPSDNGVFWEDIEAISETLPLYGEIATASAQPNVLQIKEEEKIMIGLETVDQIKELDAKNIEEAAKKVKQNRDNAEVRAATEKLTQLLDRKERLEESKKTIEKELNEVNDLVTALGYPPKEG